MKDRNYGIDALRIIAMFMIVIHHVLLHGGLMGSKDIVNSTVVNVLDLLVYCAVNCYGLISGFVGYSEKNISYLKISGRYLHLWVQVLCYSLSIATVFYIINPINTGVLNVLKAFIPVTATDSYWYFKAYTGLIFVMPLINKAVSCLSEKDTKKSMTVIILVFSMYTTFNSALGDDAFHIHGGYSFLWLVVLYFIGACVKKYKFYERISIRHCIITIIIMTSIMCIWNFWGKKCVSHIIGRTVHGDIFAKYMSPTILFNALALLVIFSKYKPEGAMKKVIGFTAPATFGVYLLHDNYLVRENLIKSTFSGFSSTNVFVMLLGIFVAAAGIFIIGILIEKFRMIIFRVIGINKGLDKVMLFVHNKISNIIKF